MERVASQFKALRNKGNVEDQGVKNRWQWECMAADSRLVNVVYLISLTRINDTFRRFGLFLVSFWYFQSKTLFLTLFTLFASFIDNKKHIFMQTQFFVVAILTVHFSYQFKDFCQRKNTAVMKNTTVTRKQSN